ncbi:unnamed protein product [Ixodes pacificus]
MESFHAGREHLGLRLRKKEQCTERLGCKWTHRVVERGDETSGPVSEISKRG